MHTTEKRAYAAPSVRFLGGFVARTLGIGGVDKEVQNNSATTTAPSLDDDTGGQSLD
jgi:hypothetical protein